MPTIDDASALRRPILGVLEERGYAALTATVESKGLKLFESEANLDLLVTDTGPPEG